MEYEGEFLFNKKWNGKGYDQKGNQIYELNNGTGSVKYYYNNGYLIFEGGYLFGLRNGTIKEYNRFGTLIFEGEYLNDEKNGNGKEYNDYGELRFEGEYFNGKKWNGKGYDPTKNVIYELKEGNGFIKEYNNEGTLIFEGEVVQGKKMEKERLIIIMVD